MKLLLRRHQRASIVAGPIFVLDVRAEFTPEEYRAIAMYGLGNAVLYARAELVDPGAGLLGWASRLAFNLFNTTLSVDELIRGKRIECKSVVEMLAVENKIKSAFATFKSILEASHHFGGEELVER
jgi:hypothetical protein